MESPFENVENKTCALYLEPILNSYYKSYQNVITLSDIPAGPIANMARRIHVPKLSPFHSLSATAAPNSHSEICLLVLSRYPCNQVNVKNVDSFMYANDIPNIFGYLENNGYKILDNLTTMTFRGSVGTTSETYAGNRRLICMFRYSNNI